MKTTTIFSFVLFALNILSGCQRSQENIQNEPAARNPHTNRVVNEKNYNDIVPFKSGSKAIIDTASSNGVGYTDDSSIKIIRFVELELSKPLGLDGDGPILKGVSYQKDTIEIGIYYIQAGKHKEIPGIRFKNDTLYMKDLSKGEGVKLEYPGYWYYKISGLKDNPKAIIFKGQIVKTF